jgi:excisionase family DNA binding protein
MDTQALKARVEAGNEELHRGHATVAEAAAFLKCSRSQLYVMMVKRELSYLKFGRCRRVPWSSLYALAEQNTVAGKY